MHTRKCKKIFVKKVERRLPTPYRPMGNPLPSSVSLGRSEYIIQSVHSVCACVLNGRGLWQIIKDAVIIKAFMRISEGLFKYEFLE